MVLTGPDGEIADTRFSKCCGGKTELFSTCWADRDIPYLVSKSDPWCDLSDMDPEERSAFLASILKDYDGETSDFYSWESEIPVEKIGDRIREICGIDIGTPLNIEPLRRGPSGRIYELKAEGSRGEPSDRERTHHPPGAQRKLPLQFGVRNHPPRRQIPHLRKGMGTWSRPLPDRSSRNGLRRQRLPRNSLFLLSRHIANQIILNIMSTASPTAYHRRSRSSRRSPWAWIPTLYVAEGLPYFAVNVLTVLMYKNMGVPLAEMAFFTAWLYLPWVIKLSLIHI